mmetsp:Transcript_51775/g.168291  ORF Transcript_51775/g.168291 Transcript_51775/m.168291 type:complete len:223 (+) Transcript_51775:1285-1953(+)
MTGYGMPCSPSAVRPALLSPRPMEWSLLSQKTVCTRCSRCWREAWSSAGSSTPRRLSMRLMLPGNCANDSGPSTAHSRSTTLARSSPLLCGGIGWRAAWMSPATSCRRMRVCGASLWRCPRRPCGCAALATHCLRCCRIERRSWWTSSTGGPKRPQPPLLQRVPRRRSGKTKSWLGAGMLQVLPSQLLLRQGCSRRCLSGRIGHAAATTAVPRRYRLFRWSM